MSVIEPLLIKRLDATVPDSFVHSAVRCNFRRMVQLCPVVPQRLSSGDFAKPPPPDHLGLVPLAYNLLFDALEDPALRRALFDNSSKVGYWFFNIFIVLDGHSFSEDPALNIFKPKTSSVDVM